MYPLMWPFQCQICVVERVLSIFNCNSTARHMSLMGTYYVPVKSTVFFPDTRNENEHTAADQFRKGARIGFANEVGVMAWSNANFKNRNSTTQSL